MSNIFVHTGLNRSLTVFFYDHVYPNLPNKIQFIKEDDPLSIAIHKLVEQEHSLTSERKKIINGLVEERNQTGRDILIPANHGSFAAIQWNTLDHNKNFLLRTKILKEILPTAKILFIVRDQIDYIISAWKCAFQQRNIMSICDFVVSRDEALAWRSSGKTEFIDSPYLGYKPWLYPYDLDFKKYTHTYYDYYGKENCCVILFDDLKNNLEMELAKILRFFTGTAHESVIEKIITSSMNADDFKQNRTASEGGLKLMGALDNMIKYLNINVPYGPNDIKTKNYFLKKIYKYMNWIMVRRILQNRSNIVVKCADFFSKNNAGQHRKVLLSKFPDLLMYYEKLNKL